MKKWLSLLILLLPVAALADEAVIPDLSGGMHSYESASKIPDNSANLIQNCFSDIEPLCWERNGFTSADLTVLGGTASVRGLWRFKDNTGSDWLIAYSSRTYYKKIFGGTFSSFGFPTNTANQPYAAINLGKIMFVNGVNTTWTFDGTTSTTVPNAPIGKYVVAWRTRFAIANTAGAQSQISFCADGDATTWALGGNAGDPFAVPVGGANDGFVINCIVGSYQDSMIIGRDYDIWQLSGVDQSDYQIRNISSEVGCIDQGSMREFDGSNMFVSHRGIEQQDASTIKLVSEPIRNITDLFCKNSSSQRSVIDTSQIDFANGTFNDPYGYLDKNTAPGYLTMTFPEPFNYPFRNGDFGTKTVWKEFENGVIGSASVTGGGASQMILTNAGGGNAGRTHIVTASPTAPYRQGTTYYYDLENITTGDTSTQSILNWTLSPTLSTTTNSDALAINWNMAFRADQSNLSVAIDVSNETNGTLCTTCGGSAYFFPFTAQLYVATTTWSLTVGGTMISSGTHTWGNYAPYVYFGYRKGSAGTGSATIDNFNVIPQTATFTSQVHFIGTAISTWSAITVDDQTTSLGTVNYQFNAATSTTINESSWTAISNFGTPTNSTNTYAAWRGLYRTTDASSQPRTGAFTISWQEGQGFPAMSSVIYDRRYWLSVSTTAGGSPYNDTILVFQRNRTWVELQGIYAASFALFRDSLYFGDSMASGRTYQFDAGNSDNGSAINTKIITKSYDYGLFSHDKSFNRIYLNYLGNLGFVGTINLTYDLDRSGNSYALGSADLNEDSGQITAKMPFPTTQTVRGREVQYTLTKSGTGDRLKLGGVLTNYDVKEEN